MISIEDSKIILKGSGALLIDKTELVFNDKGILIKRNFMPFSRVISWSEISEIGAAKSEGSLVLRLTGDNGSWPFGLSYPKIKKDGYWNLGIELFQIFKDLDSESYQKLIDGLVRLSKSIGGRDFIFYPNTGMLFMPSAITQTAVKFENTCDFCKAYMKWKIKDTPYVFECGKCHEKYMETFCPKCGMGGIIHPKIRGKGSMGIIEDVNLKPSFWECTSCHNHWPIDVTIYDEQVVIAEVS